MQTQTNETCCCEWKCSHCIKATAKGIVHKFACSHPVWICRRGWEYCLLCERMAMFVLFRPSWSLSKEHSQLFTKFIPVESNPKRRAQLQDRNIVTPRAVFTPDAILMMIWWKMFIDTKTYKFWKPDWLNRSEGSRVFLWPGHTDIASTFVFLFAFVKTGVRSRARLRICGSRCGHPH